MATVKRRFAFIVLLGVVMCGCIYVLAKVTLVTTDYLPDERAIMFCERNVESLRQDARDIYRVKVISVRDEARYCVCRLLVMETLKGREKQGINMEYIDDFVGIRKRCLMPGEVATLYLGEPIEDTDSPYQCGNSSLRTE